MPSIREKVQHVLQGRQTRKHHCHWPGCTKEVPPALWGCRTHWFMLPIRLRNKIWAAYRPGQEENQNPSRRYVEAAREVREWIMENHSLGDTAYED
jgi:hypothetical protein